MRLVSGRMRSPRPAASTMAVRGIVIGRFLGCRRSHGRRHVLRVPVAQLGQRRMGQRTLQVAPYPRDVSDVLRLAVAAVEPREDAENLGGALGSQRCIEPDEMGGFETPIGLA